MLVLIAGVGWLLFRTAPPPTTTPATPAVVQTTPSPTPPQRTATRLERPPILDTLVTGAAVLRGGGTGGAFALHAPVATVVLDDRPRFDWDDVPGATAYEVTVVELDRNTVIAGGSSKTSSWQPEAPLPRGRTYLWQVAAETPKGRVIAPGQQAEARFHVAAQAAVEGSTPLERGLALARLGALDDAERELASAGAEELLQQVRAWR